MTYGAFTQDFASYEHVGRPQRPLPQIGLCILALGMTTAVGVWALRTHMDHPAQIATQNAATPNLVAPPAAKRTVAVVPAAMPRKIAPSTKLAAKAPGPRVDGLLDPNLTTQFAAVVFARSAPLRGGPGTKSPPSAPPIATASLQAKPAEGAPDQVAVASPAPVSSEAAPASEVLPEVQAPRIALPSPAASQAELSPLVKEVPLPQPRPADLTPRKIALAPTPASRGPAGDDAPPAAPAAPGRPSFFEKLFGGSDRRGPALAYAAPEDSVIGNVLSNAGRPAPVDRYTAVYNITTHTVTLPDGTQLEAHSGLGAAKDNPRMVTLRMVGATPPNVYDLTVREAPFHGVRALRLTPTGGTTYGRAGLLAHTYMLRGRSGESNGCVVFRDYPAFLRAYDSGAIRRLAVVAGA